MLKILKVNATILRTAVQ